MSIKMSKILYRTKKLTKENKLLDKMDVVDRK